MLTNPRVSRLVYVTSWRRNRDMASETQQEFQVHDHHIAPTEESRWNGGLVEHRGEHTLERIDWRDVYCQMGEQRVLCLRYSLWMRSLTTTDLNLH